MNNITIGNGLMAKAFINSSANNCLFFCSGVSNSNENNKDGFFREKKLLQGIISCHQNKIFIYFSSILAASEENAYYKHKLEMESIVSSSTPKYLILRLPQVAGRVLNNTLLPSFINDIYYGKIITIYKHAKRAIIDVDDVVKIVDFLIDQDINNEILNICPGYSFSPLELLELISIEMGVKLKYKIINKYSMQQCKSADILHNVDLPWLLDDSSKYLQSIVKKYTNEIINLITNKM
ncbi:MAG: NAD-dependent epimerase/dehydratase family protein [Arcobacteraceae bacterium]